MPTSLRWRQKCRSSSWVRDALLCFGPSAASAPAIYLTAQCMPSAAIDAPEGFLYEWWGVFWEIFVAKTRPAASPAAASYLEACLDLLQQLVCGSCGAWVGPFVESYSAPCLAGRESQARQACAAAAGAAAPCACAPAQLQGKPPAPLSLQLHVLSLMRLRYLACQTCLQVSPKAPTCNLGWMLSAPRWCRLPDASPAPGSLSAGKASAMPGHSRLVRSLMLVTGTAAVALEGLVPLPP